MSLIQHGRLVLPTDKPEAPEPSGRQPPPLAYLGAVGTVPLSVPTASIHHHPGANPAQQPARNANGNDRAGDSRS
jgi:hypothetical protein